MTTTPPAGRVRRLVTAVLLALLVLLPAGCVSVPDSGPVRDSASVLPDDAAVQAQYVPEGPAEGAEPADIVRGYLAAMLAYPTDPSIVREFLTEQAAADWQPDAGAVIFSGTAGIQTSGREVQVSLTQLGALDGRGSWSSTPPARAKLEIDLTLVQVEGEWRISDPPPGILIRQDFFEDRYNAYSLFFFDPTWSTLVPDQVYLADGDQTATLLLRGLVRGPTKWLKDLKSLVPRSTDPTLSVPVDDDGVAPVAIGADVMSYPPEERRLLAAQLAWTLDQIPEIRAIRVTTDGAPVSLIDRQELLDADYGDSYDPADGSASRNLYALHGERIVTVPAVDSGAEVSPVAGPLGAGEVAVDSFGIGREGKVVAAVVGGGSVAVTNLLTEPSDLQFWLDGGGSLLPPQWDRTGLLWVVDRQAEVGDDDSDDDGAGTAISTILDGSPQPVRVADEPLTPDRIEAFSVSRDGMRIAVLGGTGPDTRLLIARIVRPAKPGGLLRINRWREIITPVTPLADFRDLDWASPTELAVLARRAGESLQAFTVDIDGSDVQVSTLMDFKPTAIAATPTQDRPTVVSSAKGQLYSQTNERWAPYVL
ncbi:MAG TPA: LpqB family beta-propeller domain-containing protein, partial [Nocardioidaceae bacterium]|nr:LpqB family beta-propeller domain-containing protein [Nocardioidaceae bacterium]